MARANNIPMAITWASTSMVRTMLFPPGPPPPLLSVLVAVRPFTVSHARITPIPPPTAASPVLRHRFINNVDAAKMPPDARGYLSVTFAPPLPAAPTILLQCPNPRYAVKVHGASPAGFTYAIYRTRDLLESKAANPFDGEEAAKPVTDYKAAQNIDIAWVAIADGTAN